MWKKYFLILRSLVLLTSICFSGNIHAELTASDLKNLNKVLKKKYRHLSPVHGAMLSYLYGLNWTYLEGSHAKDQKGSKIGNLVTYFFHLNADGVNFNYSQSRQSALFFLSDEALGTIIGQRELYKEKVPVDKYVNPFGGKKTPISLEDWKNATGLNWSKVQYIRKFKNNRTNRFNKLIYEQDYSEYADDQVNFTNVILAYLWQKSDNIASVEAYFEGLSKVLGEDIFVEGNWRELIRQKFTDKDFESIELIDYIVNKPDRFYEYIEGNLEEALFFLKKLAVSKYPEAVEYMNVEAFDKRYPDCGETSLLNFLNSMLYDPKTGLVSMEKVKSIDDPKGKYLERFYSKYPDPKTHTYKEVHRYFSEIVTLNHDDIIYNSSGDLSSSNSAYLGFKNMDKLVSKITIASGIHHLIRILDKDLEPTKPPTGSALDKYVLSVNNDLSWEFYGGHFLFLVENQSIVLPIDYLEVLLSGAKSISQKRIFNTLYYFADKNDEDANEKIEEKLELKDIMCLSFPLKENGDFISKYVKNFALSNEKINLTRNYYKKHVAPLQDEAAEKKFFEGFFYAEDKDLDELFYELAVNSLLFIREVVRIEKLNQYALRQVAKLGDKIWGLRLMGVGKRINFDEAKNIKFLFSFSGAMLLRFKNFRSITSLFLVNFLSFRGRLDLDHIKYLYVMSDKTGMSLKNASLSNLKSIHFGWSGESFKFFKAPLLEEVSLGYKVSEEEISFISSFEKLKKLKLKTNVLNLEPLGNLRELTTLEIVSDSSLSFLEKLNSISSLSITCEKKSTIDLPENMALKKIRINGCSITEKTKKYISEMKNLEILHLDYVDPVVLSNKSISTLGLTSLPVEEKSLQSIIDLKLKRLLILEKNLAKDIVSFLLLIHRINPQVLGLKNPTLSLITEIRSKLPDLTIYTHKIDLETNFGFSDFVPLSSETIRVRPDLFNRD